MMIHDSARISDDDLFARLRRMWRRRDPMPADLVDNVLVAVATHDLGTEYAMLTLLESSDLTAGLRGDSDVRLLEFSHGARSIMLRVSELGGGRRRIDGWIAPASPLLVRLEQDEDDFTTVDFSTVSSAEGRFDFADIPAGRTRMWLQPEGGAAESGQGFTTEYFSI